MKRINFFAEKHFTEPVKSDRLSGICDPKNGKCAYTTSDKNNTDKWCATVINPTEKSFRFVPIDNNIDIRHENNDKVSLCDGMLYVPKSSELSFVELKDYHTGSYIAYAEQQLLSTLKFFLANHNYKDFNNRRAFICNPQRPNFAVSSRERISEFFKKTHFRLLPQAEILL